MRLHKALEGYGYRPVIGGVWHRTFWGVQPPDGTYVDLLCGGSYRVSSRKKTCAIYVCHACEAVLAECRSRLARTHQDVNAWR